MNIYVGGDWNSNIIEVFLTELYYKHPHVRINLVNISENIEGKIKELKRIEKLEKESEELAELKKSLRKIKSSFEEV